MSLDLSSVNAKLAWAEEHANALRAEVREWTHSNPIETIRDGEKRGNSAMVRFIAKFVKQPPLERWGLMFGDFIHNTRSALDHFVYAIAHHESGEIPLPDRAQKRLGFPICDSPAEWRSRCFIIDPLVPATRVRIEGVQPYHRPQIHALPKLLALLRDFSNVDKHRLLAPAVCTLHKAAVHLHAPEGMRCSFAHSAHTGEVVDGTVLHTAIFVFCGDPPSEIGYNYDAELFVGFAHQPGPAGAGTSDVLTLTNLLLGEAREIVKLLS